MEQISIFEFQKPHEYLNYVFENKKKLRPQYSLSQFALKLGFSDKGSLSRILNGVRLLSMNRAAYIAENLTLNYNERLYFYQMIVVQEMTETIRDELLQTLKKNLYKNTNLSTNIEDNSTEAFSDFHLLAVRECMHLYQGTNFVENFTKIWQLPTQIPNVEKILNDLKQMNLAVNESGHWKPSDNRHLQFAPEQRSIVAQNYHAGWLKTAIEALHELPIERRDVQSSTIAVTKSQYAELVDEVRSLHQRFLNRSQADGAEQILQIGTFILPVGATYET